MPTIIFYILARQGRKADFMKYRTTAKELRKHYPNNRTIAIGYCNAQYLLHYQNPNCYTCGVYGWNFDGYEMEEKWVLITTGYRGTFGTRPDFDTLRDYEKRAEIIIHSTEKSHEEKQNEVNTLLFELIDKTLNRGWWFTLKPYEQPNENQVLVRGDYDRATKTYSCYYFGDVNRERFIKASRKVYTDFIF